jgi:hypothetical protein
VKKALAVLAAAAVLLAALLAVRAVKTDSARATPPSFDTTTEASITRLQVVLGGDSVTVVKTIRGADEAWVVLPDSFVADAERVRYVLSRLVRLEDKEPVARNPDAARLAEFGLSAAEVKRIRWTLASGEGREIHLGHTSGTDFNSTYWKRPGNATVFRTPGSFTSDISVYPGDWATPLDAGSHGETVTEIPVPGVGASAP